MWGLRVRMDDINWWALNSVVLFGSPFPSRLHALRNTSENNNLECFQLCVPVLERHHPGQVLRGHTEHPWRTFFCPPCPVAWAWKTYRWQKVSLPHCAGDPGHCRPYKSRSQNDLQSATGLRTLLVQSEMCWSPGWHYCDKTSTGSGESLSGPHSEVLIHLPPQPGSWRSWGWGQGETLELGEKQKVNRRP